MRKYIVRLTDEERKLCDETIDKLVGSSQKARRARILRQVDVAGPGWTDRQMAEAYRCRVRTVENTWRRCVLEGFEQALHGCQRTTAPVPKLLDGEPEARLIALRLGPQPEGYGNWSRTSSIDTSASSSSRAEGFLRQGPSIGTCQQHWLIGSNPLLGSTPSRPPVPMMAA